MSINGIHPKKLIAIFDKVENELEYVLEDMRYDGDDRGISRVYKLLDEISEAKSFCRIINEELKVAE